jgi:hypothetical protein
MADFIQGPPPEMSFAALVHIAIDNAYENLVKLIKKPHADKQRQAQALATFAANTRRVMLQLIVIQKWSPETSTIEKCNKLATEVQERITGLDECNDAFWRLHADCYGWRERMYDIRTAVSVLADKGSSLLPSDIRNCGMPATVTPWPKATTFSRLHDAIRFRLLDDAPVQVRYSMHHVLTRSSFTICKHSSASAAIFHKLAGTRWLPPRHRRRRIPDCVLSNGVGAEMRLGGAASASASGCTRGVNGQFGQRRP